MLCSVNNLCCVIISVPPAYYAHLAAFRARFYMEPETSNSGSMTSGAVSRGGVGVAAGYRHLSQFSRCFINLMWFVVNKFNPLQDCLRRSFEISNAFKIFLDVVPVHLELMLLLDPCLH